MTAPALPDPSIHRRWRAWVGLVLGLCAALALLAWAGSGSDASPRRALPWDWTADGWLIPAPGFTWLWLAAGLVFWLLSTLAWLLFTTPPGAVKLKPWVSAALILLVSAAAHLAIARTWSPIDAAFSAAPLVPRPWLIAADLTAVVVLLFMLHLRHKSLWWAALYAWHPLVLIEVAANSSPLALAALALLVILAADKLRWLIVPLVVGLLALGLWGLTTAASAPFNGFAWELARNFLCQGNEAQTTRLVLALLGLLELALVLLALRRRWTLPTTLVHMAALYLLFTPAMFPAQVLLPLVLLPLAWNRALWILSLTSLSAYAALLMQRQGYGFVLPDWLLMLAWTPVAIVEAQTLVSETLRSFHPEHPLLQRAAGAST